MQSVQYRKRRTSLPFTTNKAGPPLFSTVTLLRIIFLTLPDAVRACAVGAERGVADAAGVAWQPGLQATDLRYRNRALRQVSWAARKGSGNRGPPQIPPRLVHTGPSSHSRLSHGGRTPAARDPSRERQAPVPSAHCSLGEQPRWEEAASLAAPPLPSFPCHLVPLLLELAIPVGLGSVTATNCHNSCHHHQIITTASISGALGCRAHEHQLI